MSYSFSDNIQRGILYLIKHDRDFYSQIVGLIKPEYFEFPSYSFIFERIKGYYDKYKTIPPDDILLEDIKKSISKGQDFSDYEDDILQINNIDQSVLDNREFVLDLVEDYAKKQAISHAIKESVLLLKENRIAEIEEKVRQAMLVCREVNVGQIYFDDVDARFHRQFDNKDKKRFKTVFNTHNEFLDGGLSAKELAMVIAPPGVGKSLYLVNQGVAAIKENKKVLYISLEMAEDKIAQRFDAILTMVPTTRLKEISSMPTVKDRLTKVKAKYADSRLIIKEFPTGQLTVNQIRALLVQLKLHHDFVPDILIVDYLELLRPNRVIDAEYQAQERIAQELRGLAMENNILVWTATQTNRQGKKVATITDAELGDSYGKIRPADWAISLNQTQEEYDKGRMRVYVVKARDSKQHYTIQGSVNYTNLTMEEMSAEEAKAQDAGE
jgi:replicative DNA helicase